MGDVSEPLREAVANHLREWVLDRFGKRIFITTANALADDLIRLISSRGSGGWQPIETAPRDGTQILTFCDRDGSIEIDAWWTRPVHHFEEAGDGLFRKVEDDPYVSWSSNGHRATHWQPLPTPPQKKEGDA